MTEHPHLSADLARALTAAARTINEPSPELDHTLQMIVEVARDAVPGFDHAGISTIERRGTIVTRAQTDSLVTDLDNLQYRLEEGPCVSSMREEHVVQVPFIRHEQRWPRYVPDAVRMGLKSQLAVQLYLDDKGTVGGLNLYSTEQEELDPDAVAVAELFAVHAALAFGHAKERVGLSQALGSRKVIGQAIGIAMERYELDEDRAFNYLLRASQTSNIKLRDIAAALVEEVSSRSRRHQS